MPGSFTDLSGRGGTPAPEQAARAAQRAHPGGDLQDLVVRRQAKNAEWEATLPFSPTRRRPAEALEEPPAAPLDGPRAGARFPVTAAVLPEKVPGGQPDHSHEAGVGRDREQQGFPE
jgi:hypothetical protein